MFITIEYLVHLYSTSKILDMDLTLTPHGHKGRILKLLCIGHIWLCITVCSGRVVVTAYDFESGRTGSNTEWGPIYYKASITAQGFKRAMV